jgi:zinc transport system substrate-binding protein
MREQLRVWYFIGLVILLSALLAACGQSGRPKAVQPHLTIVTTLFPLYDFTRSIAGDKADVHLLLPPGTEAHSFEPKPSDMARLTKADLFIFTSRQMEPWAEKVLKGTDNPSLRVVDTSAGIAMIEAAEDDHHDAAEKHDHGKADHDVHDLDPHVWLDFTNATKMIATIRDALIAKDAANRDFYVQNAQKLTGDLNRLDKKYAAMLTTCEKKTLVSGGHFAFGYLAKRYGLSYQAAYGFSPSAEPSPKDLIQMSRLLKKQKIKYLFYEELIEPRIAETIAKETGVGLIMLHGAHNISRDDLQAGVTFTALMERNYEALRRGLQCR